MMRKEQHKELHKALQEKQNQREKATKPNGDDLLDLLQSSNNSQSTISEKNEGTTDYVAPSPVSPRNTSNKPSLSRPLVPPGFASSTVGDRKLQKGSSSAFTESEVMTRCIDKQVRILV
jgi:hypothetical protein